MGIDPGSLGENILSKMSLADRGKKVLTAEEAVQKAMRRNEKKEHQIFINWLRLNRIPYRTDRMDRRVSGSSGWPDFLVVYGGRVFPLEFKVHGNKLSEIQHLVKSDLGRTGTEVAVCYSADEAIRKTRGWLWENFRLGASDLE